MVNYVFLMLLKINIKVLDLMSRDNETHPIKWHVTWKRKQLDASALNNKQCWNAGMKAKN